MRKAARQEEAGGGGWRGVRTAACGLLVAALCAPAVGGERRKRPPCPEQPLHYYWFRTGRGGPRESKSMDPRLRDIAEAFGRGEYQEARKSAEALLGSTDDATLRAEAVDFVIESHLAEGDFEGARAAGERFEGQDAVTRISEIKAAYLAEVGQLQGIVATTKDPGEAARAQVLTARVHRLAGLLNVAQGWYWGVVSLYPDRREAGSALSEMVGMHLLHGDPKSAVSVCRMAIDLAPEAELAVGACETICELSLDEEWISRQEAREHLRGIAGERPGTRAAAAARFAIGELYVAEGSPEEAEGEWAGLLAEGGSSQLAAKVRIELAELRYEMGMRAFLGGDWAKAVRWLEPLLPDVEVVGVRAGSGGRLGEGDRTAGARGRHAVSSLGEAYQKVGEWGKAAEVFARLAVRGNPAEEVALFQLGRSRMEAGDGRGAVEAFRRLKERFPESSYIARCEDYVRAMEGGR